MKASTDPHPSPAQQAYTAYLRSMYAIQQADPSSAYQMLPARERRAWEAVVQAVLACQEETPHA